MSVNIKILGVGCAKCQQTTAIVKEVVSENNINATIEKIEDVMKIVEYNVLSTPAVMIDDEVKIKGRVPSKEEILELLSK
jgi:small redox-active disulfide protein 2